MSKVALISGIFCVVIAASVFALLQDATRGERLLAMDLYRYLHDQGMEFQIEPRSASGEVDLLADQTGDDRLALTPRSSILRRVRASRT